MILGRGKEKESIIMARFYRQNGWKELIWIKLFSFSEKHGDR